MIDWSIVACSVTRAAAAEAFKVLARGFLHGPWVGLLAAGFFAAARLDNYLAETVEGAREPFNPHGPTPGRAFDQVNGMASPEHMHILYSAIACNLARGLGRQRDLRAGHPQRHGLR